jgi:hypothetical protein
LSGFGESGLCGEDESSTSTRHEPPWTSCITLGKAATAVSFKKYRISRSLHYLIFIIVLAFSWSHFISNPIVVNRPGRPTIESCLPRIWADYHHQRVSSVECRMSSLHSMTLSDASVQREYYLLESQVDIHSQDFAAKT